jgi:hypothetical protein
MDSSIARSSRSHVCCVRQVAMPHICWVRERKRGALYGHVPCTLCMYTHAPGEPGDGLMIIDLNTTPTTTLKATTRHLLVYRRRHRRSLQPCARQIGAWAFVGRMPRAVQRYSISAVLCSCVQGGCFIRMDTGSSDGDHCRHPDESAGQGAKGQKAHVHVCDQRRAYWATQAQ